MLKVIKIIVADLSWVVEIYSAVLLEPKGQNQFGNETGHSLLNLSVILGSKEKVMIGYKFHLSIL